MTAARVELGRPVARMAWSEWFAYFAGAYRVTAHSADHVTIIGPTGTGKTTLALELATLRRYKVVLGCKPVDHELAATTKRLGYHRQTSGDLPANASAHPAVVVWPRYRGQSDRPAQRAAFERVFETAFQAGGWHIICEEAPHLVDLGMRPTLTQHLRMGRSMSSGLILCTQRPRGIPLEAISGASHLILFGNNDDDDLKRLGGMNGVSSKLVRETVAGLGRSYDFLHVDTRTGALAISRFDRPRTR